MKIQIFLITGLMLIKFNNAFSYTWVNQMFGKHEYIFLSSVNISKECGAEEKCIWKCCPEGQMMDIFKTCKPSDIGISNSTVYNQHHIAINKSLNSVFRLVPNLLEDETFAKNALWWYEIYLIEIQIIPIIEMLGQMAVTDYKVHIKYYIFGISRVNSGKGETSLLLKECGPFVTDGRLFLQFPNLYDRWIEIETNHFCVDMKANQSKPVFMVEYEIYNPRMPDVYKMWSLIISTICLIVALVIYAMVPELKDLNGVILMMHFGCLFMNFVMHCILENYNKMHIRMSEILAISCIHYFFKVSSFAWTNVMFYRLLVSSERKKEDSKSCIKQLIKYCAYAFGLSLFMTIFTATFELSDMTDTPSFVTPQILDRGNFTFHELESLYYLYYPLIILLTFNWIVCFIKVTEFCKPSKQFAAVPGNNEHTDESFNSPMQFVKLLTLLSIYAVGEMLTVIFFKGRNFTSSVYNLCIGPIILIIFIWNKNVLSLLSKRLNTYKRRASDANPLVFFFHKQ